MNPSDYFIESCTLFDDQYLSFHDLIETRSDNDVHESKSHLSVGGFSYTYQNDYRFIIWRIAGNQLELIEQSLVYKLNDNCKRIVFKNAMIIPRVHVHKDLSDPSLPIIQILLTTTAKLYRLVFRIHMHEYKNQSIFYNFSVSNLANIEASNSYQINLQQVDTANIYVSPTGDGLFSFLLPSHSVCCIQMPPINKASLYNTAQAASSQSMPIRYEINQPNIVKRLWSGITRTAQDSQSILISYRLFNIRDQIYLISLCKDSKIKVWCLKTNQCIFSEEVSKHIKIDHPVIWEESMIDLISLSNQTILSVVLTSNSEFKVCNLRVDFSDSSIRLAEVSKKIIQRNGKLVHLHMTCSKVWLMCKNDKESIEIVTIAIDQNNLSQIFLEETSLHSQIEKVKLKSLLRASHGGVDENEDEDDVNELDDELLNIDLTKTDLKEAYLKLIFEPYRFSKSNIQKALGVLASTNFNPKRTINNNDEMKTLIIQSIEREVQSHPSYENCAEEDFLYLTSKCWSKFYTMLKQYDYDSRSPVGLFVDKDNESLIILIRKNALSVYNRADISQFYKDSQVESVKTYLKKKYNQNFDNEAHEIVKLLTCIKSLSGSLKLIEISNNSNAQLNSNETLNTKQSNFHSINSLTDSLIFTDQNILNEIYTHLSGLSDVTNLNKIIQLIMNIFESEAHQAEHVSTDNMEENMDLEISPNSSLSNLSDQDFLRSEFSINCILASFFGRVVKRYDFLKSLTVLINIIRRFFEKLRISRELSSQIIKENYEKVMLNLNGYEYLKWLNEIYPVRVAKVDIDKNLQRITDLIDDYVEYNNAVDTRHASKYDQVLIKSFIQSCKHKNIFDLNLMLRAINLTHYDDIYNHFMSHILKIIWPSNSEMYFNLIKHFLFNAQYSHLNNFCIYTKWMQKGKNLRYFLLANCALFFNNIDQSIDMFLKASHLINNDQMLKSFIKLVRFTDSASIADDLTQSLKTKNRKSINIVRSNQLNNCSMLDNSTNAEIFEKLLVNKQKVRLQFEKEDEILLKFYIKVIHYFDLNGNIEASIELVQNALLMFQFDSQSRSTLYVILFRSYMSLEYYDKAHQAIVSNTDLEWKQNCLKTFIGELCNQNKTAKLVGFDYGDMLQDVLTILYERANLSDLRTHDYYHIIYALHVKQKDYVKAAFCMFESASRLKRELNGINSLKRQEKCYLACLNALKLVDKKYAWIFNKTTQHEKQADNAENSINYDLSDMNINFKIIDLNEIKKNYTLCHYAVRLASITQNQMSIPNFNVVEETVSLLHKYGLYDDAIVAANLLNVSSSATVQSLTNIFLSLVDRCCFHDNKDKQLFGEFQSEFDFLKNNNSIPISFTPYENPTSFKWKLLVFYLQKYKNTIFYQAVCRRLLKNGSQLVDLIVHSLKLLNPNALLNIYIEFDKWEDSIDLINDQIELIVQNGPDFQQNMLETNSKVYLSYACIDKILYGLGKSTDKSLNERGLELRKRIEEYLSQIKMASDSIRDIRRIN